jgi:outer membrane protein TolC
MRLANMREAEARLREMELKGKEMALDIALEVNQAVLALQESAEKIRVASQQRELALRALEETRRLYQSQVAGVDALLQAEVARNRADVAYTAAIFEAKIAQALLQRALGDFTDSMEAKAE